MFLDVDGTLLDLAPRPDEVAVVPGLLDDLAAVESRLGGALALVSGRPIAELDRLFAPLRLAAGGIHGAELRRRRGGPIVALTEGRLADEWWRALARLLDDFPGSYAEHKRVSFAVHYRDPGTDVARLAAALAGLIAQMARHGTETRLARGHAVFEVQLRGFDKGRAIERLMAEPCFAGRKPIFVGDDAIDRPAFDKALALGGGALAVGIELPGLSGVFAGPAEVRAWLHEIARREPREARTREDLLCRASS
ncbi:MAG TPA: trehalose-phosphatase [Stellaceae bacterium]|nr:trehalose-phosphatase [Stellaceae bacterium]